MYDVIVIGAGPAGLAAGLYASRARLKTLILEKEKAGGQIVITDDVENYPGSVENASGPSLIKRMKDQVDNFGAEFVLDSVQKVELEGKVKKVIGKDNTYEGKTVIVATGATPRKIGCPGEVEFTGRGVSYCATCDANFFEDMEVYVVGGGDSAFEEAMYLSKFARKVTLVYRKGKEEARAAESIKEKAFKNPKLDYIWNANVVEVKGDGILTSIVLEDTNTHEKREIFADENDGTFGLFVFVGYIPKNELVEGILDMENGYVVTDENMHTNIPGVFAAGDNRKKELRQVVTATADGAIAATQAEKYINEHFE
ncbi:MAG: thioredoxin-disulfide reductase [Ezakiella sp.]|mgnify:FL=1|uniref:thioredoxin-disulfide reductase n=1 Tax=Ezakiella sp. TaxID=1935205 RepID=UPI002973EE85|nr:thioredoxin-disulfide reductase [Ezakiella sp.]MDD7731031.1 thioredoxin-disulfide reductase [Eubacteriales bacterium]MDY6080062.1 thioredoxin-disulfide reductase [Ezakiella sp.]